MKWYLIFLIFGFINCNTSLTMNPKCEVFVFTLNEFPKSDYYNDLMEEINSIAHKEFPEGDEGVIYYEKIIESDEEKICIIKNRAKKSYLKIIENDSILKNGVSLRKQITINVSSEYSNKAIVRNFYVLDGSTSAFIFCKNNTIDAILISDGFSWQQDYDKCSPLLDNFEEWLRENINWDDLDI